MILKHKHLIFLLFLFIFIILGAHIVSAMEVSYPNIPGLPTDLNENPSLGDYISYFFGFLVYTSGIIALISFAIGSVMLISPDPSMHREATDRMKGSLLGLLLCVGAFIILRTINPAFITPSLTPLPGVQGIYYWNGTQEKPVGMSEPDVQNRPKELAGYNSIKYDCDKSSDAKQPVLLIWEFPKANLDTGNISNLNSVKVARINCGGTEPIGNLGSFRMAFETPGIYYCYGKCDGDMCQGDMSESINSDQDDIPDPFNGNIGGVRIVNQSSGSNYGVIFHVTQGLSNAGDCTTPIIAKNTGCFAVNINAVAANIFIVDHSNDIGNGVNFFSKPTGWNQYNGNLEAGYYQVTKDDIYNGASGSGYYSINMNQMCFSYKDVSVPEAYKHRCSNSTCGGQSYSCKTDADCPGTGQVCDTANNVCIDGQSQDNICSNSACETFENCPGSIQSNGTYLIGLYSVNTDDSAYCQTFTNTVPNLNVQSIVAAGSTLDSTQQKNVGYIIIIPTQ